MSLQNQKCKMQHAHPYQVYIKSMCLFLSVVFLTGCASQQFRLELTDKVPIFKASPVQYTTSDSTLMLKGWDFIFTGQIDEFEYEPDSNLCLVSFREVKGTSTSKEKQFILFDENTQKKKWYYKGNPNIFGLENDLVGFSFGDSSKLYNAFDGTYIRNLEQGLTIYNNNLSFIFSSQQHSRIDLRTGKVLWQKPGAEWQGFLNKLVAGNWIYIYPEALRARNIENGEGWDYLIETSHAAHGKEIARQSVLAVLSAMSGSMNVSSYHAQLTHNVCSEPLILNDKVLWAAAKKMLCFEKETGKVLWEVESDKELGSMSLYTLSDQRIALVGNGWKYVDFIMKSAAQPSITIFSKKDGEVLAQFKTDEQDVCLDFQATEKQIYLLASEQLYQFSNKLDLLRIIKSERKYGKFIRLLSYKDEISIRTTKGVLILDTKASEKLNFIELGEFANTDKLQNYSKIDKIFWLKNYEQKRNWQIDNVFWLADSKGLTALKLGANPQKIFEMPPMQDTNYWFSKSGDLIYVALGRVKLLHIRQLDNGDQE